MHGPTLLSKYLKELQKMGLITRDVDTRKYRLLVKGWVDLFLLDLERMFTEHAVGKENVMLWGLSVIVSEDGGLLKSFKESLEQDAELSKALAKISHAMVEAWKRHVFSTYLSGLQKTILKYEDAIKQIIKIIYEHYGVLKGHESFFLDIARINLALRYEAPEQARETLATLEAEKMMEELQEAASIIDAAIINLMLEKGEDVDKILQWNLLPDDLKKKLRPHVDFIKNPENIDAYKRFLKALGNCPKAVVAIPSTAFSDYLRKYWEAFPSEKERIRKETPLLYQQIVQNFSQFRNVNG